MLGVLTNRRITRVSNLKSPSLLLYYIYGEAVLPKSDLVESIGSGRVYDLLPVDFLSLCLLEIFLQIHIEKY